MNYTKNVHFKNLGPNGQKIEPWQLQKINSFALRELTPDEVYVRQFILCHNGIDRDGERFSEAILEDFKRTLPGKSVLQSHNRNDLPKGLFFDAFVDSMTPEGFSMLTGESIKLPDNISQAVVLFGWTYFLKAGFNEELLSLIDGGIARYVSIGFRASDLVVVKGPYDQILYQEYAPPAEALEGSIVWLGAQPGATIKSHSQASRQVEDWRIKNPLIPEENQCTDKKMIKPKKTWPEVNPLIPGEV